MEINDIINSNNNSFTLVAVSKTKTVDEIQKVYNQGQTNFGENRVNELMNKQKILPKNIKWHMIGHLQRNKVKTILPIVHLIHSVDSIRLINTIEKESKKINKKTSILLQIHIAEEKTKYGFSFNELRSLFKENFFKNINFIDIKGLMGMATYTNDKVQIRNEFKNLKLFFVEIKTRFCNSNDNINFNSLSMGMSGDYTIALEEGSNIIRIGTLIFGERDL